MPRHLSDAFLWPVLQLEAMQRTLTYFSRDTAPFPLRYRTYFAETAARLAQVRRELQTHPDTVTSERQAEESPALLLAMAAEAPPAPRTAPEPVRPLAPLLQTRAPHKQAHWLLVLAAESAIPRRTAYLWWQEFCVGRHTHVRAKYAPPELREAFVTWIRQMQLAEPRLS
jgi:hypothetical protein